MTGHAVQEALEVPAFPDEQLQLLEVLVLRICVHSTHARRIVTGTTAESGRQHYRVPDSPSSALG